MHEEIRTASDLYERLSDQKNIGVANVKYIDDTRLANRRLDYLPIEIEKMEIHPLPVVDGPADVLVINDHFVLYPPYLIFPDETDLTIIIAYDISDTQISPKYKFSLN